MTAQGLDGSNSTSTSILGVYEAGGSTEFQTRTSVGAEHRVKRSASDVEISRSARRFLSSSAKFHSQELPPVSPPIWRCFRKRVEKALDQEGDLPSVREGLYDELSRLFERIFASKEGGIPHSFEGFLHDIKSKSLAEITQKYALSEEEPASPLVQNIPGLFSGRSKLLESEVLAIREEISNQLHMDGAGKKDEMLRLLISEKSLSRARKGENFDAYVISRNETADFVRQLQANIPEEGNRRVHLLIRSQVHYTALDFEMSGEGLKCFIMDAANDVNCFGIARELGNLGVDEIYLASVKDETGAETGKLQNDGNSCPVFSMDHIVQSSKVPRLFEELKSKRHTEVDGVRHIPWIDFDPSFVKNAQSLRFFERYNVRNPEAIGSTYKPGLTFAEYIQSKTGVVPGRDKPGNMAARLKLMKYRKKLEVPLRVHPNHVLSAITCRSPLNPSAQFT